MNTKGNRRLIGAVVSVIIITPRIARFFYPQAHFEDAPYLDVIASLARGLKPHVDFIHTHFVFPEIILAFLYRIFSPTYRVTEAVTAIVVTATAAIIYLLGKELRSRRVGAIAAILFSIHPNFFLYHIFEKEIYEAFLATLLALLVWRRLRRSETEANEAVRESPAQLDWRFVLSAALICLLGYVTKIDFSFLVAAVCLYLLLIEKRAKDAFALGGLFLVLICAISLICRLRYGREFFNQVYLFHFFKGHESSAGSKIVTWVISAGYLLIPGIVGLFIGQIERNKRYYLIFWMAGPLIFFLSLTETFWGHNMIGLLPQFSILCAIFADELIEVVRGYRWVTHTLSVGEVGGAKPTAKAAHTQSVGYPLIVYSTVLAMLILSYPYARLLIKFRFGFGFTSRAQVERVSAEVRKYSRQGDIIIAPAIIAAQSNRTDIVHNREVYPVYVWAMGRVREVGFRNARKEAMQFSFRQLYEKTKDVWLAMAWHDIESGRAAIVVGDTGDYQSFNPDQMRMFNANYKMRYVDKKYSVWAK